MPEAHPGMMVTPSVRLVRPLGEGGMGAVWVADHLALQTQVVVKFIASALKDSKDATDRFSREAAAAAQVKSPHVVQTFDHGVTVDGTPYIVMELLEGRDLGELLEQTGRLAQPFVLDVVTQLARALDRAHARGIVHRDIKPGNVFLCDAGPGEVFVKLLDFGIAKGIDTQLKDSGTKTGAMIGSPFYMSPEQVLGSKSLDHRTDVWSVGVLAFEALTGQKPFDAETMGGLAIKIHSEPLPLPSSVAPDLSPAIDRWFERACARRVTDRFSSAGELAAALGAATGSVVAAPLALPHSRPPAFDGGGATTQGAVTSAVTNNASAPPTTRSRLVAMGIFAVVALVASFVAAKTYHALVAKPVPTASVAISAVPPIATEPPVPSAKPEPPPRNDPPVTTASASVTAIAPHAPTAPKHVAPKPPTTATATAAPSHAPEPPKNGNDIY